MTGTELIALLADPAVRDAAQRALSLPTESVSQALRELAAAQAQTDASVKELTHDVQQLSAAQAQTDASVKELTHDVQQLSAAQARTDATVRDLGFSQARTDASLKQLAERTDASLQRLAERTDASMKQSAAQTEASFQHVALQQGRTDRALQVLAESLTELSIEVKNFAAESLLVKQALGTLSDNVGFGLEELAAIVLPGVLERNEGIQVDRFTRRHLLTELGEEEIDVFGEGERSGEIVPVVGEVKSRIYTGDVKKFAQKLERVTRSLPTQPVGVMFGFVVHPAASAAARELGVHVVASRPSV